MLSAAQYCEALLRIAQYCSVLLRLFGTARLVPSLLQNVKYQYRFVLLNVDQYFSILLGAYQTVWPSGGPAQSC